MLAESHHLHIVLTLMLGFGLASLLGYIAQKFKFPTILGYLLAGYVISPYSPGFVGDVKTSEQLAEIGVILMMFEVGLHFNWKDLLNVKGIAIPGAIAQTFTAALATALFVHSLGWPMGSGIVMGLAVGVASTVVLVRVLTENELLATERGHIAIGWLIVEDIFTVIALLLLPSLAIYLHGQVGTDISILYSILIALAKFVFLTLFMLTLGKKIVSRILAAVARTRSHELFTLSILALIFSIAIGSTLFFGTSIALGAFIAGMVIGETDVKYEASANALPIKDAFVVLFFVTVGMLFNPVAIFEHSTLFFGLLIVILMIKPLVALIITLGLKYSFRTALTISVGLSQIGEFSFILGEEAMKLNLLPEAGFDILVACAIVSISLNPLLFRYMQYFNLMLETKKYVPTETKSDLPQDLREKAIIVGYGPIGESVDQILTNHGIASTIIDRNVDTIIKLGEMNRSALFGDASSPRILEDAQIAKSKYLIITVPHLSTTMNIIQIAKKLNKDIKIVARANFISEQPYLEETGVPYICCELESKNAFDLLVKNLVQKSPLNSPLA